MNNKKEGLGIEETEDYIYEGYFDGDCLHGKGKLLYKKFGDKYEGEFCKGLLEGKGVYTWKNKETYSGVFLKGKMHGFGVYKWPNGREFFGEYCENMKHGKGEFHWKSGKILKCTYDSGKPIGTGILINQVDKSEKILTIDEIKQVLKSEKKLNKEHSFLEYINTEDEKKENLNYELCSVKNDENIYNK